MTAGRVVSNLLIGIGFLLAVTVGPLMLVAAVLGVAARLRDAHARVVARGRDAMEVRR